MFRVTASSGLARHVAEDFVSPYPLLAVRDGAQDSLDDVRRGRRFLRRRGAQSPAHAGHRFLTTSAGVGGSWPSHRCAWAIAARRWSIVEAFSPASASDAR